MLDQAAQGIYLMAAIHVGGRLPFTLGKSNGSIPVSGGSSLALTLDVSNLTLNLSGDGLTQNISSTTESVGISYLF